MEDEKAITLRKPIALGGVTYAEIILREPVASELAKATREGAGNDVEVAISLISQIGQVPKTVAGKLCQRDLAACNDYLGSFIDAGQETGETSSQN